MSGFHSRIQAVCQVASASAHDVDTTARFPAEAHAALRDSAVLGALVPVPLGGEGLRLSIMADACCALSRACSSAGMMLAMHSVFVECLRRHAAISDWHASLLRDIASSQLLVAGSTSEGGGSSSGIRASGGAVETRPSACVLVKRSPTISFAREADCLLATARRAPEAESSDQVLVALRASDYSLDEFSTWNAFGMRGTCSAGYVLNATFPREQIFPVPFSTVHAQTMLPVAHVLWSCVWNGIAADAVGRAKSIMKRSGRDPGCNWSLLPLTQAVTLLHGIRAEIAGALMEYERAQDSELESFRFRSRINSLKVSVSTQAINATVLALQAGGLAGYQNDSPHSLGRHIRDICSAPIMIGNAKILETVGALSLLSDEPDSYLCTDRE